MANPHPKYWCRSHLYSRRRSSQPSLQALDARADKHSIRRDKILMCAIFRVWLAHVREREVTRQRDQKLLYSRFLAWKKKVLRNRQREGNLQHTAPKPNSQLICTWRTRCCFLSENKHTCDFGNSFAMARSSYIAPKCIRNSIARLRRMSCQEDGVFMVITIAGKRRRAQAAEAC